jgi:ribose transport system substrate-binding protein
MAERAAALVQPGDTVFLDGGPLGLSALRSIGEMPLTVITNDLEAARLAAERDDVSVQLLGGAVRRGASRTVGPGVLRTLRDMRFRRAIVEGTAALVEGTLVDDDPDLAAVKRQACESAEAVVGLVAAVRGTVGRNPAGSMFLQLVDATELVLDPGTDPAVRDRLRDAGCVSSRTKDGATWLAAARAGERPTRIACLVQGFGSAFDGEVRHGIETAVRAAGTIDLITVDVGPDGSRLPRAVELCVRERVDAVVAYDLPPALGARAALGLREAGLPAIAVEVPMGDAPFFGADNYRAGWLGGSYLGREILARRTSRLEPILVLARRGAGAMVSARSRGQVDGLRDRLRLDATPVHQVEVGPDRSEAAAATTRHLDTVLRGGTVIVLAADDEAALGATAAIREAGAAARSLVLAMGAGPATRLELQREGSPLVVAVAFRPETYGDRLIPLLDDLLSGRPVPPATFVAHDIVTAQGARLYGRA